MPTRDITALFPWWSALRNKIILALCLAPSLAWGAGAELFTETCGACHGEAGEGMPGFAPSLDRPDFWQALGDQAPTYLAGVMVSGLTGNITAGSETFYGLMMPPQSALSPTDMVEIGQYVLSEFGGDGAEFTQETVDAALAAPPDHATLRGMRPAQ